MSNDHGIDRKEDRDPKVGAKSMMGRGVKRKKLDRTIGQRDAVHSYFPSMDASFGVGEVNTHRPQIVSNFPVETKKPYTRAQIDIWKAIAFRSTPFEPIVSRITPGSGRVGALVWLLYSIVALSRAQSNGKSESQSLFWASHFCWSEPKALELTAHRARRETQEVGGVATVSSRAFDGLADESLLGSRERFLQINSRRGKITRDE